MNNLLFCLAVLVQVGRADTIDFKDETSMNGSIVYKSGLFEITGRWNGKQSVVKDIPARLVKAVRFNSIESNAGATPAEFVPFRDNKPVTCEVILRDDSKSKIGVLESIDEGRVRIGGTGLERKRITILRLVDE